MKENIKKSHEIDIVGIIKRTLLEWKLLLKFMAVSMVVGVIIAFSTDKIYKSDVVLAPEISGAGGMLDNLSDLASMVGVKIGSSSSSIDAIYPEIYPDVISSSNFIVDIFPVEVTTKEEHQKKTYYNHLKKDMKIPFWLYPKIWISSLISAKDTLSPHHKPNPYCLTKEEENICQLVRSRISCIVDKKTSVITISVKDNDPLVAAIIADTIQLRLQQYITEYRTKKARVDLNYSEQLYNKAKDDYESSRKKYAATSDANTRLVLESYKSALEYLEEDMQLKFNIFTQATQQLHIARAKLQERTPVFSIIQCASVPNKASSLPRSLIVLCFIFLGCILCALWITYLREPTQQMLDKRGK